MKIYLCGSIKKGSDDHRDPDSFWSDEDERELRAGIAHSVALLNPAKSRINRADFRANYGCDLFLVMSSDILIVDLRKEKGLGVGAEMMLARNKDIPVIGWVPEESHYRRKYVRDVYGEDLVDWIHPFVFGLCDYIESDLAGVCRRVNQLLEKRALKEKTCLSLEEAVSYFVSIDKKRKM